MEENQILGHICLLGHGTAVHSDLSLHLSFNEQLQDSSPESSPEVTSLQGVYMLYCIYSISSCNLEQKARGKSALHIPFSP